MTGPTRVFLVGANQLTQPSSVSSEAVSKCLSCLCRVGFFCGVWFFFVCLFCCSAV